MGHYSSGAFSVNYINSQYAENDPTLPKPKPKIVPNPYGHEAHDRHLFPNLAAAAIKEEEKVDPGEIVKITSYK